MEVDDTNVDSSSSTSGDEDKEEQEWEIRAEQLEKDISVNKYVYDAHIELIELYRKLGDLNSLRAAYKRFHECYPLTPSIWLSWIKEEIKLANLPSEVQNINSLFESAVKDYLSVSLWQEYGQFSIGTSDLETTRTILERGLNAAGLHVTEGSLLWDTLRELELAHLSLLTPESKEWKEQATRVNEIFRRQLSVPLLDMEQTYSEWKEWVEQLPNKDVVDQKPVEWGYQQALKTLATYKLFEDRLLSAHNDQDIYDVYTEYIKAQSDPSVIICLYERAIAQLCLNTDLWIEYAKFSFKLGEISKSVSERALLNCPWYEDLWIIRLQILEHQKCDESEIRACFETGISSVSPPGIDLWFAYLEYNKRSEKPKDFLNKLFDQAIKQVGNGDLTHKLPRFQARILARQNDIKTMRHVWKNILHNSDCKGAASAWLEYISLERQYGEANQVRVLFQRALNACTDWPQSISEEWLMYERECGSLEDVMKCEAACKKSYKEKKDSFKFEKNSDKTKTYFQTQKRKTYDETVHEPEFKRKKINENVRTIKNVAFDHNLSVFLSNLRTNVDEVALEKAFPNAVNINLVKDRKGVSRCYGYVQFDKESEVEATLARDRELLNGRPMYISRCREDRNQKPSAFKYSDREEHNKLFIRGLPLTTTKEDLEKMYESYKPVAVRLVTHKSGQPKGLAYVEFEDDETANKALKETDQMKVGEFTITVAISAPPPKTSRKQNFPPVPMPAQHAKRKLQIPLVPRALQVKPVEQKGEIQSTSKSNADFRKMFLN